MSPVEQDIRHYILQKYRQNKEELYHQYQVHLDDECSENVSCNTKRIIYNLRKDMSIKDEHLRNLSTNQHMQNHNWFVKVVNLVDGNSFGELSLLSDAPRAATVVCESTEVVVAVIKKESYKKVFEKIEMRQREERIKFFKNIQFIKNWSKTGVQKLILSFVK